MFFTAFHAGSTGSNPVPGTVENADGERENRPQAAQRRPQNAHVLPTETGCTVVEKPCPKCAETKPAAAFGKSSKAWHGLQSWCKECHRATYRRDPEQREKSKARSARWREQNPDVKKAHRKLQWAIESGKMTRGLCECCGTEKTDAHHWNGYDNPYDVQWLCRSCHVTVEPRRGVA